MVMSQPQAVETAKRLHQLHLSERGVLDLIRLYWRGKQSAPMVPPGTKPELARMAAMSRINLVAMCIGIPAQSLSVAGYRQPRNADNLPAWTIWQANKMAAAQEGIHRAALAYGASYAVVARGEPHATIRGVSPRKMVTEYAEGQDWPLHAMEMVPNNGKMTWRLWDDEARYTLELDPSRTDLPTFVSADEHRMEVAPVVRFRNVWDLDDDDDADLNSEVLPLISLQDQMDLHTFHLLVAEHFQSFRQRYVIGWTAEDEAEAMKASAASLMQFGDDADRVKVGEFGQVELRGYLESRTATQEFLATIAQVPPHNMLGKMVNLSAEALAAAESGHQRKLASLETSLGSSWDQALGAAGWTEGLEAAEGAEIRWRDSEARALAATVDALGKLSQMLGVPPQELWEQVPGVTEEQLARWKAAAAAGDSLGQLAGILADQATPAATPEAGDPAELKAKADAMGALIRAGADPAEAAERVGLGGMKFIGSPSALRLTPAEAGALEGP